MWDHAKACCARFWTGSPMNATLAFSTRRLALVKLTARSVRATGFHFRDELLRPHQPLGYQDSQSLETPVIRP
jgi:hypothetical protein